MNRKPTLRGRFIGLTLSLFVSALFVSSCRSVPVSGRKQLILVSEETIMEQSLVQYKSYVAQMPQSTDPKKTDRVLRVCKRIAAATDKYLADNKIEGPKMQWEFAVIADRRINAFCMPGGKIVIYTGILPLCETDDELATVISHEVSHAIARHSNERLSHEVLRQMGGNLVARASSREGAIVRTVINQAYGLGSQLVVSLPYSRSHEFEADRMGLTFMALAGYDPRAAVSFWQKMAEQGGKSTPEFMSTHPSDANRIKEIEKHLPEVLPYYEAQRAPKSSKPSKK